MRTDTLYHLQRKYGAQDVEWKTVAVSELGLTERTAREKSYREQYASALGMWQKRDSQKAPWFVDLKKLADYLDTRKRKRA